MQGDTFIREETGESLVYPGHPLVVATAIMAAFPDFCSANKPTKNGWCEALGDNRIPGAGDHVGAAMRCLQIGSEGSTPDQMIEFEGRRLPVLDVDISSASHPFWTGRRRELDSEGRVERYRRRYGQEAPR